MAILTIEDLYAQKDGFLRGLALKLGASRSELDDLIQDVYLRIIRYKTLNVYDVSRGISIEEHLYQVVRTVVFNNHRLKKHRTWGNAKEVHEESENFFWDYILQVSGLEENVFQGMFIETVKAEIEKHPSWGQNLVRIDGDFQVVQKSYSNIYYWLVDKGLSKTEVARRLGVSSGSVTQYLKRIRVIIEPVLQKWEVNYERKNTAYQCT